MTKQVVTLGDALPVEMARVRDDLIPQYQQVGPAGAVALALMRDALDRATRASIEGDVIAMIRSLEELRGFKA